MGLLTKPAGGVFDMVSMAFDGVQRYVMVLFVSLFYEK